MLVAKYYRVAGHVFEVRADNESVAGVFLTMDNYLPFEVVDWCSDALVFSLDVDRGAAPVSFTEEFRQQDEGQEIVCGKTVEGLFEFKFLLGKVCAGTLVCDEIASNGTLYISDENRLEHFALNNALMVMFALATACRNTALFHSAVVMREGYGYLFLGKSGTGKSTHACQWLKRFGDAELLNDDNPVIRFEGECLWVYGSPWSGKTACYRNERARVAAIVNLSQASRNIIEPIEGLDAYLVLVNSISGMRWNRRMADGLHETENRLAQVCRIFHMDCLPNENAAEVCFAAVAPREVAAFHSCSSEPGAVQ